MRALLEVSDATGIGYGGVDWLAHTIATMFAQKQGSISTADIVRSFIVHLTETGKDVETLLETWHIKDSSDVGRMVFALCEQGVCGREDSDTPEAFDGLFTTTDIRSYIRQQKIKSPANNYHRISYAIGIVGIILIIYTAAEKKATSLMLAGWAALVLAWLLITFEKHIRKEKN